MLDFFYVVLPGKFDDSRTFFEGQGIGSGFSCGKPYFPGTFAAAAAIARVRGSQTGPAESPNCYSLRLLLALKPTPPAMPALAQRIVSLLPAATEIAWDLGLRERLVGRSHECDVPEPVLRLPPLTRPRVDPAASSRAIHDAVEGLLGTPSGGSASLFELDVAALATLRPDVILTQATCAVCAISDNEVAEAVGDCVARPRIVSLSATTLAGLWADVLAVGAATGTRARARELVAKLQARCDSVRCRTASLGRSRTARPRVAMIEWLDPPMAAGNWVPELVRLAGGDDCLGRAGEHSHWIDWSTVANVDPDVIILAPCGFPLDRTLREAMATDVRGPLAQTRAAREGRLWVMDGHHLLNRPGPRLVDSLEVLASILQPGRFAFPAALSFSRPLHLHEGSSPPR